MASNKHNIKDSWMYKNLKKIKTMLKNILIDVKTIPYFFDCRKLEKVKERKIKIAFMCQYIPTWNKFEPLYREMEASDDFEPYLVCVPDCIQDGEMINYPGVNETYRYFCDMNYANVIDAFLDNNWLDLKELKFDYIFYTRPYNHFMPHVYSTENVKKYARIASLIYGMVTTKDIFEVTMNTNFYKDVYIYYAETSIAMKMYKKKFPITTRLGLRKVKFLGYPVFEQIVKDKDKTSSSWEFSKNAFRVIWTPRWTTAKNLGGSNFFVYYKSLIEYAKKNQNVDFLLRPHPLTFGNFIKTGEMTKQEVDDYIKQIDDMPNMSMDKEKEYNGTIWGSDALITDISAFLPEYYITGKPIIFCASNMFLEPTEETKMMLTGCYVSHSEEETYEYLDKLKCGDDPLKDIREKVIDKLFGDSINTATKKIVESVYSLSI